MSEDQTAADLQFVAELRVEAAAYNRQWLMWLGLGSAGGIVALLSFTANLPDPDLALQKLWPSLALFSTALLMAGLSLLVAYLDRSAMAEHQASASNRDRLNAKIGATPEVISSPPQMASRMNAPRDAAIKQSKELHDQAERAWLFFCIWRWSRRALVATASVCFTIGLCYPLYLIYSGTRLTPQPTKAAAIDKLPRFEVS